MTDLVRYEQMRVAVEQCARIDEAADLRDKAAALSAYARQRDDRDLDVWMSEIKLRASVRIGELVRELDTAQGARSDIQSDELRPTAGKKSDAIAEAGLSKSTAHRYQELAGPRDQQAQSAGKAAAENYFAQARQTREPATMDGLRSAVKEAVAATIGPRPPRPPIASPIQDDGLGNAWIDWISAVEHLAIHTPDLAKLARRTPSLAAKLTDQARRAVPQLAEWLAALEASVEAERPAA